jgi:hypothetical protein
MYLQSLPSTTQAKVRQHLGNSIATIAKKTEGWMRWNPATPPDAEVAPIKHLSSNCRQGSNGIVTLI